MADPSKDEASGSSPDRDRVPESEEEEHGRLADDDDDDDDAGFAAPAARRKPSLLARHFAKLELDAVTIMMMFK